MKLKIKLEVSEETKSTVIELSDYGITDEEWDGLDEDERDEKLQEIVDHFDQPYWVAEKFEEL